MNCRIAHGCAVPKQALCCKIQTLYMCQTLALYFSDGETIERTRLKSIHRFDASISLRATIPWTMGKWYIIWDKLFTFLFQSADISEMLKLGGIDR